MAFVSFTWHHGYVSNFALGLRVDTNYRTGFLKTDWLYATCENYKQNVEEEMYQDEEYYAMEKFVLMMHPISKAA
ncbi:hypothetical protein U1Q18_002930 [Sarracenia purpurea var. burkii]